MNIMYWLGWVFIAMGFLFALEGEPDGVYMILLGLIVHQECKLNKLKGWIICTYDEVKKLKGESE